MFGSRGVFGGITKVQMTFDLLQVFMLNYNKYTVVPAEQNDKCARATQQYS